MLDGEAYKIVLISYKIVPIYVIKGLNTLLKYCIPLGRYLCNKLRTELILTLNIVYERQF